MLKEKIRERRLKLRFVSINFRDSSLLNEVSLFRKDKLVFKLIYYSFYILVLYILI